MKLINLYFSTECIPGKRTQRRSSETGRKAGFDLISRGGKLSHANRIQTNDVVVSRLAERLFPPIATNA